MRTDRMVATCAGWSVGGRVDAGPMEAYRRLEAEFRGADEVLLHLSRARCGVWRLLAGVRLAG